MPSAEKPTPAAENENSTSSLPKWHEIDALQERPTPEMRALRMQVLTQTRQELLGRMSIDPTPDDDEKAAGILKENLELQCREAVFKIRRKGHQTLNSGFGVGNLQVLDGVLDKIDPTSVERLTGHGFMVFETEPGNVSIAFKPETADLAAMTERWDQLADLMPDLGEQAHVSPDAQERFLSGFQGPGQYGYETAILLEQ